MHVYRSHNCGELRASHVGKEVRLSGWVHRKRDHGGLLFIDLRDHYGLTQCVVEPEDAVFPRLEALRPESVITVSGPVVRREPSTINPDLPTGEIELRIRSLEVQSEAAELPLPVFGGQDYPEETRLKYRFLDLRRDDLHRNIMLRSRVISSLRRRMTEAGFFEFQTPILTASSPEGARDFLVPSRLHPGKFYALPQAPQQFKQLIMVAGFDRYFQIAPCFRDEDARADRSPGEFYQLDIEMSFVEQEDVFEAVEPVLRDVFVEFAAGKRVTQLFPRLTYADALLKYGTDKPDLRNPIQIAEMSALFARPEVEFKAFKTVVEKGGVVRAIPAPEAAARPRSFFDKLNDWARAEMKAPGLGYVVLENENGSLVGKGPIAKFIPPAILRDLAAQAGAKAGDAIFFAADSRQQAETLAGAARLRIGRELGLVDENQFAFCWIVDFPMYEWNETEKRIDFSHNPFSMPQGGLAALNGDDPLDVLGFQYDIVCNGVELSSGAIRNHKPEIMYRAFEIAGYTRAEVERRFGGMIRAMTYGAPPHGGIAPGIDRIVMLLAGVDNLREVTMFPLNQRAEDLMLGAPSEVSARHLRELHLRLALPGADKLPETTRQNNAK
jgi:aspartyl-tRNA synthetase